MSDVDLTILTAAVIRRRGFTDDRPTTVPEVLDEAAREPTWEPSWSRFVPEDVMERWRDLPLAFKLGVLAVAASDPMGVMAGAAFEND